MNVTRRVIGRAGAAAGGLVVGVAVVFAVGALADSNDRDGTQTSAPPDRSSPTSKPSPPPATPSQSDGSAGQTDKDAGKSRGVWFLAWAPGSLPPTTEGRLEDMEQVRRATTVYAGLDWIASSRLGGKTIDRPPAGYGIPFEIAAVEPREYAFFVDRRYRAGVRSLDRGEALLAETAEDLRGAGRGLRIDLEERTVRAVGVVGDVATNGYEALLAGPPPPEWTRADRFVLVELRRARDRPTVERTIEELLPAGQPLQTRLEGENPFLRYGDAVLPQLLVKETFGEFAARPLDSGYIDIADGWVRRNIREHDVPILGPITCHRLLFPQLEQALSHIRRQGLAHTIHPRQFSGCFSARFIGLNPGGRLSHHSWGMAIDINAEENTFGTKGNMDMRVVDIFEDRWGFTWGGRWVVPDAMHFEWIKFP